MIKAILFDFDYTLVDSSKGIFESVNYALKKMNIDCCTYEDICKTIGLSLPETFFSLTGIRDKEKISQFKELFFRRGDEVVVGLTVFLNGVPQTIRQLRSSNKILGIVSTKLRYRISPILKKASLNKQFSVVVGGEDVKKQKPNPEGIFLALQKLELSSQECLYVGDGIPDAEAAKRAGVKFIAVTSGTTPKEEFGKYRPEKILKDVNQLSEIISSI